MRDRTRELSNSERDDYDRAVLFILDDLEEFLKVDAETRPSCSSESTPPAILADPVPTPQTRPSESGEKI